MLINFFYSLRHGQVPVTLKEFLILLEGLAQGLAFASVDEFYQLARTCLVKDEKHYDKFDRAFGAYFHDLQTPDNLIQALIPDHWLRSEFVHSLTEEEKAAVAAMGGLEQLLAAFKQRLEEQQERHAGGNKWVGTSGTSAFGNEGFHPDGMRAGGASMNKSAAKVWERRDFKNLDDSTILGTRNIKIALRKLRRFARTGAAEELDLDDTIRSTAEHAGLLDIKMVPERHNAVKVLLFFDVGGSMDAYIRTCEELFSACKTEFKHLEYYYFHNFIYDAVWRDNCRRFDETTPLLDVLHTYSRDYKVIVVGDASMGPYEITARYGSVESMNEEPGQIWFQRLANHFEHVVWLNPTKQAHWRYTPSIDMVKQLADGAMFPLTLQGLDDAIKALR